MRSLAALAADEVTARLPVPPGAKDMLDIGGSHGHYSVCLCRTHPGLRSVILDLPDAVKQAAPILAEENAEGRVVHRPGNALSDDLGECSVDIVFMSQLVHHFTDEQNRSLMKRVARALRPSGVCVMLELIRPKKPGDGGQTAALLDLYFAMISESGTWPIETMQDWLGGAGLTPERPIWLRTMPGGALVVGRARAGQHRSASSRLAKVQDVRGATTGHRASRVHRASNDRPRFTRPCAKAPSHPREAPRLVGS